MKKTGPKMASRLPLETAGDGAGARIRSLLRRQSTLVLATADEHGVPHTAPLFFLAGDDLRLYWFSSRATRHSQNCARNPAASIAVFRNTSQWRQIQGVQMQGSVSVVADRTLRSAIRKKYCSRFQLDARFAVVLRLSSLYCFTPSWVRLIDNARRFGEKIEIGLKSDGQNS